MNTWKDLAVSDMISQPVEKTQLVSFANLWSTWLGAALKLGIGKLILEQNAMNQKVLSTCLKSMEIIKHFKGNL